MRRSISSLLIGFAVLNAAHVHAFEFTNDTAIVIPERARESTKLGARELAEYVKKISGTELVVQIGPSAKRNRVLVGTLATLENIPPAVRRRLEATDNTEAFCIYTEEDGALPGKGETLWIVGKKYVAELWGVYALLEEQLGVRWMRAWTPEDPGEYVPRLERITLENLNIFRQPRFSFRKLAFVAAAATPMAVHGQNLAVRNKFHIHRPWNFDHNFDEPYYMARVNLPQDGGHNTLVRAIPPKTCFEIHPEYFALQDGKRVSGHQYCLANPEVHMLLFSYYRAKAEKFGPENFDFLFGMIDVTYGWCECELCRRMDETEEWDPRNVSTRFHKVASKVSARILETYPDARLSAWAYHTYRSLPKNVTYDKRVKIEYCDHGRCYGHAFGNPDCARNAEHLANMKEWSKLAPDVIARGYFLCSNPLYVPHEINQAKDIRLYDELGFAGWLEEGHFTDANFVPKREGHDIRRDLHPANWQWLYVTSKLLWDPSLDETRILADVESRFYGLAYPAMKKYHDYRRTLWLNSNACMGYPTGNQRTPQLLNAPGSKEKLLGYLDAAEELAVRDPLVARRVKQDRAWLQRYWVKPNEVFRSKSENACSAPTRTGEIVIDGDGSDGSWTGAYYIRGFRYAFGADKGKEPPAEQRTTVGLLSDDENLYFLVTAMEPEPARLRTQVVERDGTVWEDDAVEFFIMPPSAAMEYYQIAVNSKGVVYDARCPGNHKDADLGAVVASRILEDRYVLELRVPTAKIYGHKRGDMWKFHVARNRRIGSVGEGVSGRITSLDGVANHDTSGYLGVTIGSPYIRNGTFDAVDEHGTVEHWSLNGASPIKVASGYALRIPHGRNAQHLLYGRGVLHQRDSARRIKISCRASSADGGELQFCMLRYTDTSDPKAKHGYRREFHPTEVAGGFKLTVNMQFCSARYTVRANEWVGLMLFYRHGKGSSCTVDDVAVTVEE